VGRNRLYNRGIASAYPAGPAAGSPDRYHCAWGAVVGDRIRRLRQARDMTLYDLTQLVHKPEGGPYSAGYLSRLERGWASAPLYVYLAIAAALDVDPGILLGPDAARLETSESEAMLLRCLRGLGVEPHEALLRLTEISNEKPSISEADPDVPS
jgi:transcriptional regulator with XRE-family HTH domain